MKNVEILAFALMPALVISCSREAGEASSVLVSDGEILCLQTESRTALDGGSDGSWPVVWTETDVVEVYSPEGDAHSSYTLVSGQETAEAVFSSPNPVAGTSRMAVYPADACLGCTGGNVRVNLGSLAHQTYSSGLSDPATVVEDLPLWASEDPQTPGTFRFNNICAAFLLQLNDYQNSRIRISSVEIRSASKSLTGIAIVNPACGVVGIEDSADNKSIKVVADTPVPIAPATLSLEKATDCFLIFVPAGTYPAGDLTFVLTDELGRVFSKTISGSVTLLPGEVKRMRQLQFTLYYGTANCIVVEPGSAAEVNALPYYSFDPLYAYENNRIKTSSGTDYFVPDAEVEVLWELAEGAGSFSPGTVLANCSYTDGIISLTAGNSKGNALVAIKNEAGTILWSFHIWVTDTPKEQSYTNISGGVFLDRNLGATTADERCSKSSNPQRLDVMGLYYQHGRKDPFACSLSSWNTVISSSESTNVERGNIAYSIQHPDVRLLNAEAKYQWYKYGECYSFWGSSTNLGNTMATITANCETEADCPKTVYDPCPAGYKVPEAKYMNYNLKDTQKAVLSSDGFDVLYDGINTAYWPANGYMCQNTDTITASSPSGRRGTVACYWTCGGNLNYSTRLFATSSAYTLQNSESNGRAAAAGVRCLKIPRLQGTTLDSTSNIENPEDENFD